MCESLQGQFSTCGARRLARRRKLLRLRRHALPLQPALMETLRKIRPIRARRREMLVKLDGVVKRGEGGVVVAEPVAKLAQTIRRVRGGRRKGRLVPPFASHRFVK